MRPPICAICGKRPKEGEPEGGHVSFLLTEEDLEFNKKFEEPGFVGHPRGLEWFCHEHLETAKQYKHLYWEEARAKILEDGKWYNRIKRLFIKE